jgi:uncharacterized membrane protein YphA (DoxX/SURF4 family)
MSGDTFARNTLAPLILRLALAAIFIYHGVDKIASKDNTWGASWANAFWNAKARPPDDLLARIDKLPDTEETTRKEIRDGLFRVYAREATALPPTLQLHAAQIAVAWGELIGGVALLLGVFARLAAAGLIVIQFGAIVTVTAARGFSFEDGGGYEYNLAILSLCACVVLLGSGTLALDRVWRRKRAVPQQAREQVPAAVSSQ